MRVHVLGAQETNAPWAFEIKVIRALQDEGVEVDSTDYRALRGPEGVRPTVITNGFIERLLDAVFRHPKADAYLVCRGEYFPWDRFKAAIADAPIALWLAENIRGNDAIAKFNLFWLAQACLCCDIVFLHDQAGLPIADKLHKRVRVLPCVAMDPEENFIEPGTRKDMDCLFIGTMTDYRQSVLDVLWAQLNKASHTLHAASAWGREQNALFNRARVVLNIHMSDQLNTETRLAEAMGAGACVVSEPLSMPLYTPGEHLLVGYDPLELAQKVLRALHDDQMRQGIAMSGYRHTKDHHTIGHRVRELIRQIKEL